METENKPIIADTSGLVSLMIVSDANHQQALEEARTLLSERPIMLPSEVVAETINILGKKFGHEVAIRAGQKLLNPDSQYLIVETDLEQLRATLGVFGTQKQSVSFTDCLVMKVADEYGTKDIFGFDKQFEDAGYRRLKPAPARKEAA